MNYSLSLKEKRIPFIVYLLGVYCFFPFSLKYLRTVQVLICYGFAFLYILVNLKLLINIIYKNKFLSFSLLLRLLLLVFVMIAPVVTNSNDYSYFSFIAGAIRGVILIIAFGLYLLKHRYVENKYDAMLMFIKIIALYVGSSIILFVPSLRSFWKAILYQTEGNEEASNSIVYFTRFGVQGFSGFGHTILCTVGITFYWVLKMNNKKVSFLYFILLLLGTFFYGRVGSIASLLVSVYFSIAFTKYRKFSYIISISILLLSFLLFLLYWISVPHQYGFMSWVLEPFVNILKHENLSSSSDHLKTMYVFDFDVIQMLFGHGFYTNSDGSYYKHTDVGLLRIAYYSGILYLILYYMTCLLVYFEIFRSTSKSKRFFSILAFLLVSTIFEIKGESIYIIFKVMFFISLYLENDRKLDIV